MKHIITIMSKFIKQIILVAIMLVSVASAQTKVVDKIIALVGNEPIKLSDVQQQKFQYIENKIELGPNGDCIILEDLMFQTLLIHQAQIDSVEVSDDMVEAEMNQRFTYYKNLLEQYGKTFEEVYGKSEVEWKDELTDVVKRRLQSEAMERDITANVSVRPQDVRDYFNDIPKDSIPYINSSIEVAQIVIEPSVSVAEQEAVKLELMEIRQDIIDGKHSFDYWAVLKSQDPGSSTKGGYFDCVPKGTFVPEFDAMAFSMKEGEISQPFKTQFGWHILKLEERRGNTYCGRHILMFPKVSMNALEVTLKTLDSLKTEIEKGTIDFEKAASMFSTDEDTKYNGGKVANPQTGSTTWEVGDMDRTLFMLVDKMEPGQVSKPTRTQTRTGKDAYRIVTVLKRTIPHEANLKDDYQLIQNAALSKKKGEVLEKWTQVKINEGYVRIDEEYHNCDFRYNWLKNAEVKQ